MIILLSFLFTAVIAAPNIALLREVIYSIFVFNTGNNKHRRKKADKLHRSQSVKDQITLSYTKSYIVCYKSDFDIYYRVYRVFLIACVVLFPLLAILGFILSSKCYVAVWFVVGILNCVLFITVKNTAKVGFDHHTKYDRN